MHTPLHPLYLWLGLLLGLAIGSFLNVVGLRFLRDESILSPPSQCPHCNNPLRPWDNIPVLSYLLLGGQCRFCKEPISIQYPLVELGTGLLFAATVWQFGLTWETLFLLFLVVNLMVIIITDWRESYIFELNSLSLIPAGLLYNLLNLGHHPLGNVALSIGTFDFTLPQPFISALLGVLASVVFFEGLIFLSNQFFGTEGFGHGDTHLMAGVGAYLGWERMLMALMLGFFIQTLFAIPVLVIQWIQRKDYVSLGSGAAAFLFGLAPLWIVNLPGSLELKGLLMMTCIALTVIALWFFLRQVKQTENFTYMPLGPALVFGTLIVLFGGSNLIRLLIQ